MPGISAVPLIHEHFSKEELQEDAVKALNKLEDKVPGFAKLKVHREMDVLAIAVSKAIESLTSKANCPRFLVPMDKLDMVPGTIKRAHDADDHKAVSARLASLEKQNENIMKL